MQHTTAPAPVPSARELLLEHCVYLLSLEAATWKRLYNKATGRRQDHQPFPATASATAFAATHQSDEAPLKTSSTGCGCKALLTPSLLPTRNPSGIGSMSESKADTTERTDPRSLTIESLARSNVELRQKLRTFSSLNAQGDQLDFGSGERREGGTLFAMGSLATLTAKVDALQEALEHNESNSNNKGNVLNAKPNYHDAEDNHSSSFVNGGWCGECECCRARASCAVHSSGAAQDNQVSYLSQVIELTKHGKMLLKIGEAAIEGQPTNELLQSRKPSVAGPSDDSVVVLRDSGANDTPQLRLRAWVEALEQESKGCESGSANRMAAMPHASRVHLPAAPDEQHHEQRQKQQQKQQQQQQQHSRSLWQPLQASSRPQALQYRAHVKEVADLRKALEVREQQRPLARGLYSSFSLPPPPAVAAAAAVEKGEAGPEAGRTGQRRSRRNSTGGIF